MLFNNTLNQKVKDYEPDSYTRTFWRSKEAIDFVYALQASQSMSPGATLFTGQTSIDEGIGTGLKYVLFLEDDVEPTYSFVSKLKQTIEVVASRHRVSAHSWSLITLYEASWRGEKSRHKQGDLIDFRCCTQVHPYLLYTLANALILVVAIPSRHCYFQ